MIASIPLTQGQVAVIDEELVPIVGCYKWCASWCNGTQSFYGQRTDYSGSRPKSVQIQRFIWQHVNGSIPDKMQVDHINGNTLDNRLDNLRIVTNRGNQHNRRDQREGQTSSKYVGVTWSKSSKKWMAQIRVRGANKYLGHFDTEEDARTAYQKSLREIEAK